MQTPREQSQDVHTPEPALRAKPFLTSRIMVFILTFWLVACLLLPVVAQSFWAFLLLCLAFVHPHWRLLSRHAVRTSPVGDLLQDFTRGLVLTAAWMTAAMLVDLWYVWKVDLSVGSSMGQHVRLIAKTTIYGLLVPLAFVRLRLGLGTKGKENLVRVEGLLVWAGLYLLYMLAQRYWGWDWVRGWDARLAVEHAAYGVYRANGMMSHPLTLGYNLLFFVCLSFAQGYYLWSRRRREAKAWFGLTLVLLVMLLFTGSRYPFVLAFLLVASTALYLTRGKWGDHSLRRGSILALALLLGLILVDPKLLGRFRELLDSSLAWQDRFDRGIFWQVHAFLIAENPVFGTGLTHYPERLQEAYELLGYSGLANKYNAHNIYLQTWADSGLFGVFGLLSFLGTFAYFGWRTWKRWQHPGPLLLFGAILFGGMMQNHLRDTECLFALWFGIGWILLTLIEEAHRQQASQGSPGEDKRG